MLHVKNSAARRAGAATAHAAFLSAPATATATSSSGKPFKHASDADEQEHGAQARRENAQVAQRFQLKQLLTALANAEGGGTSMISLFIPPGEQMHRVAHMLNEELATASNIRSRINRLAVEEAIRMCLHRVRLMRTPPPNGMAIFAGQIHSGIVLTPAMAAVLLDGGRSTGEGALDASANSSAASSSASASAAAAAPGAEGNSNENGLTLHRVSFAVEPLKPLTNRVYLCDKRFHVETLLDHLEDRRKFGAVVIDGHGTTLPTASPGCVFDARLHYVRRIAALCVQTFITGDGTALNVNGLILAGAADLKRDLYAQLDQRLVPAVLKLIDTSYGGRAGLNQAMAEAQDVMSGLALQQEMAAVQRFFDQVANDESMVCFGGLDTIRAIEAGAVELVLLHEDLHQARRTLVSSLSRTVHVEIIPEPAPSQPPHPLPRCEPSAIPPPPADGAAPRSGAAERWEVVAVEPLVPLLLNLARVNGAAVTLIPGSSSLGMQFVRGFGGVGGMLRFPIFREDGSHSAAAVDSDVEEDDLIDIDEYESLMN
ncbi:eukaryotic peptide chain release factor subunit 1 [Capsaspora owczarzaki ATCC 30864]|uniref:Eukaryotic peptide chain release factor subunit 1 n=1 Tax=Capsaspora owczarzaki (strain ATCC 30864) TaxID=595528 RepID=A0A0D2X2B7_CAPO3|nr:eukaryotic peptide chain release factor subunit 1 [Capsaspora owczarzaki ATCC 30864]KJE92279.1 eukaryotic peptide chain release factor subunit 1 [Capsaspora owczarzaki ATCC 30864]|eukprot:XP_004364120.1 eukaryotic peptide chain release factor subunit 1 [Capsaspora owczarzaki ATCC 30864]